MIEVLHIPKFSELFWGRGGAEGQLYIHELSFLVIRPQIFLQTSCQAGQRRRVCPESVLAGICTDLSSAAVKRL